MLFLIKLPPPIGALISALISVVITATLFVIAHLLFRGKRTESTRPFAQQMALRIGTMHALVVALVFGVLTSQLINLYQISDAEAISAANIYWTLKDNQSPEAVELRRLIPDYLQTIIEKEWKSFSVGTQKLPAWKIIVRMQTIVANWEPSKSTDEIIRNYVFNNVDNMAISRDRRNIERLSPNIPQIFWLIAVLGYVLTLVPYLTIEHSNLRLFLVCSYAIIIGILLYGIAALDHPFLAQVIQPTSFEVMLQEILAGQ